MKPPISRVALIGPWPPPYGGMANQTRLLKGLLETEGIHVELVPTNLPYRPAWIGRIPIVRAGFRLLPYLWHLWRAAGRNPLFHVMANSGWSWHLFAAPAIWIAALRDRAVVLNYRGGEAETFFRRAFRWVAPTLRRCQQIIVPSRFLQAVFTRFGVEAEIVPNPVDLARFADIPSRRPLTEAPVLIVCRNLEAIYGIDVVLHAFHRILVRFPRARLYVAGTGPEEAVLRRLAGELGISERVIFRGRLSPEEISALYAQADLMLNASRVDNTPNALLEAMAAGVPVATTDAGGIPYLVTHGHTALLVPVDDDRALARAALEILETPALRKRLIRNGKEQVFSYTWEAVKPRLFASYAKALAQRKKETMA